VHRGLAVDEREFRDDDLAGVRIVNAHPRPIARSGNNALVDGKWAYRGRDVAAIAAKAHSRVTYANLTEGVVDIGVAARRRPDYRNFRKGRYAAAHSVELPSIWVRAPHRPKENRLPTLVIRSRCDRQMVTVAARSFGQLRRFHHGINSDKVFGTHRPGSRVR